MDNLKPGDKVRVKPEAYDGQWLGTEKLWRKFKNNTLTVDRVVDLRDVDDDLYVIVDLKGDKERVKAFYLCKM